MHTVAHDPATPAAVHRLTWRTDDTLASDPRYTVARITAAYVDAVAPRARLDSVGYGVAPTRYRVTLEDGRTRRVYVDCFSNGASTPWVRIAGVQCYLAAPILDRLAGMWVDTVTPGARVCTAGTGEHRRQYGTVTALSAGGYNVHGHRDPRMFATVAWDVNPGTPTAWPVDSLEPAPVLEWQADAHPLAPSQIERAIARGDLSPAARNMPPAEVLRQYAEANALTLAEAAVELGD